MVITYEKRVVTNLIDTLPTKAVSTTTPPFKTNCYGLKMGSNFWYGSDNIFVDGPGWVSGTAD